MMANRLSDSAIVIILYFERISDQSDVDFITINDNSTLQQAGVTSFYRDMTSLH